MGLLDRYENVRIKWANGKPNNPEEWALVVEVKNYALWTITAYLLKTTDKAKAVRRAWGWGLKDEDGNVIWPPEPDEDDDIDDDPYIARYPEPEIKY